MCSTRFVEGVRSNACFAAATAGMNLACSAEHLMPFKSARDIFEILRAEPFDMVRRVIRRAEPNDLEHLRCGGFSRPGGDVRNNGRLRHVECVLLNAGLAPVSPMLAVSSRITTCTVPRGLPKPSVAEITSEQQANEHHQQNSQQEQD